MSSGCVSKARVTCWSVRRGSLVELQGEIYVVFARRDPTECRSKVVDPGQDPMRGLGGVHDPWLRSKDGISGGSPMGSP